MSLALLFHYLMLNMFRMWYPLVVVFTEHPVIYFAILFMEVIMTYTESLKSL